MVPVAKAAILLVLLGGATVSTYAVANGGFGNKAKSSEGSKETTGAGVSEETKPAATGQIGKEGGEHESGSPGEVGAKEGGESAAGPSGPEAGGAQKSTPEKGPDGDQGATGTGVAAGGTPGSAASVTPQ